MTTDVSRLMGMEAAARFLDISPRTLRRWVREGRIRAYRVGPRLVRFSPADLKQLVQPMTEKGVQ